MNSTSTNASAFEKPQNGLKGLRYWRNDLGAALVVAPVAVAYAIAVANVSGVSPVSGLISAIIAGVGMTIVGGSYVAIGGPAAGLAPAIFACLMMFGHGNKEVGYPLLLAAISIAGVIQIIMARYKMARFAEAIPLAVIEGMLAGIGATIIVKGIPQFLGRKFTANGFWGILHELPAQVPFANTKVFTVGMVSLGGIILFAVLGEKIARLKTIPPQIFGVVSGMVSARILGLEPAYLVQIPANPLHGITLPNFSGLLSTDLIGAFCYALVVVVLIDGGESLASSKAIARKDPYHRQPDSNRVLLSMGVCNLLSSLLGGITIIAESVKSYTNIMVDAKTSWSNFFVAIFVAMSMFFGRSVLNMMPLVTLGAVIAYTGFQMCRPRVWHHVADIGKEQLVIFATTFLVSVTKDILWGIIVGMITKLIIISIFTLKNADESVSVWTTLKSMVRNPVTSQTQVAEEYVLYFNGPLLFLNAPQVVKVLDAIPTSTTSIRLRFGKGVTMVDHTSYSNLLYFVQQFKDSGCGEVFGLEYLEKEMRKLSDHHAAVRLRDRHTTEVDEDMEDMIVAT